MAAPIEIGVASETKAFRQGVETGVIKPLEDAADALDDLGKSRGPDQLERAMEDAQDETQRLRKDIKETADTIDREFRNSYRSSKQSSTEATTGAKRDLRELGEEARQNAAETFSSFDGSVESFADGLQGTLGGIVSSLGPIGAAAGAAGALGIGLIMNAFAEGEVKSEEFRQKVAELATELIDTGDIGQTSIEYIVDQLKSLATESDEGKDSLADLAAYADRAGRPFERLAQAYAGNAEGLDEIIEAEREYGRQLIENTNAQELNVWAGDKKIEAQRKILEGLQSTQDAMIQAEAAEAAWVRAGGPELEAKAERIDALNDALEDSIGSYGDYVNAESGALDPAAYIAGIQARIDATSAFNSNIELIAQKFGLSQDEVQAIVDEGIDFAPMLQAIIDSGLDSEFVAKIRAAVGGGQEIVNGADLNADVDVSTNAEDASGEIDDAAVDRDAAIDVAAEGVSVADRIINQTARDRTAKVTVSLEGVGTAENILNNLTRTRRATIIATVKDQYGVEVY